MDIKDQWHSLVEELEQASEDLYYTATLLNILNDQEKEWFLALLKRLQVDAVRLRVAVSDTISSHLRAGS